MTSTLTDPKIQNISTIVTPTNAKKFEKYSNDVRADLDLRSILPTSLPVPILNETLPAPLTPIESDEENQEDTSSDDDSASNSGDE